MAKSRVAAFAVVLCGIATLVSPFGCGAAKEESAGGTGKAKHSIAFVTNQQADFWNIAKAGCLDAQKELDVEVQVRMPDPSTVVEQQRVIDDLLTAGIDAIAISPIDAENQKGFVAKIADDHFQSHCVASLF